MPAPQNTALDILAGKVSFTKAPLTRDCGQYVLDKTLESSPLRELVREIVQQALRGKKIPESFEEVIELLSGGDAAADGGEGRGKLMWRAVGISSYYLRESHVQEEEYRRR